MFIPSNNSKTQMPSLGHCQRIKIVSNGNKWDGVKAKIELASINMGAKAPCQDCCT